MFGCASEETELRHASHTPDGNSIEEEIDRRAGKKLNDWCKNGDLWWWRPDGKTSRNGHSLVEFA